MALSPTLLEILACPDDKGPLLYFADEDTLYNPRLKTPSTTPGSSGATPSATTSRSC
jgi:hypothetical protein